jgi:cyclin H
MYSNAPERWLFTGETLQTIRMKRLENACKSIQKMIDTNNNPAYKLLFLTLEEEQILLKFYHSKIKELCQILQCSDIVYATATIFFKRFHLKYAIFENDPSDIAVASLLLAAKVENMHINIGEICKKIPGLHSIGLERSEILVAKSLDYQFMVLNVYTPLYGLFLDSQSHVLDHDKLYNSYKLAVDRAHISYLTDVYMIYTASQVALAIYKHSCSSFEIDLSLYIEDKFNLSSQKYLLKYIDNINSIIDIFSFPSKQELWRINEKLRGCRNPILDSNSVIST